MKEKKNYFCLRIKGGNTFHPKGTCLNLTEKIVNIGETVDCDIRFESDELQPEYYASIIQNEDGKSWRIVKRSQYIDISIVGKGIIGYAHQLTDGDIIHFGEKQMAISFHTRYDEYYEYERQKNMWQRIMTGLSGLMVIIALFFVTGNRHEAISTEDVEPFEESIYLVKVDSVRRILLSRGKEECMFPTKILEGEAPTGTAFLTTEGKLVTARHCVEFWIGANLDLTTKIDNLKEDDIVRWAIETETFNQTHDSDSTMQLQVFFSVFDFIGNRKYSFASTDKNVRINRDKDGVFLIADFSQNYYWRTIRPYFTDRQMELGDILWVDSLHEKGKIKIADKKQMNDIRNGTKLMICGYPMTGIGDKRMTATEGGIRRKASIENESLFFESNINHGFSGGPVLMKTDNEILAIGVVSRVDSISSGLYKWAVPVTEIKANEHE